jgi:hypothetical protein
MAFPNFTAGDILNASDMNAVGLWLIKTQTVGTAVASVTVTDAFSSTYNNYRIIYTGGAASASCTLSLQFGIGGTMTTTNYYGAAAYANLGAAAWQLAINNPGSQCDNVGNGNTTSAYLMTDVLMPNLAEQTSIFGPYVLSDFGRFGLHSFAQLSTTQFTSFKITPSSGTLTGGTIRVYGYRN